MRTRLLLAALSLLFVPASGRTQTCFFSGGNAWVKGAPLLACNWNGKPAFLVISWGGHFVNMGSAYWPNPDPISFQIEAAYVQDLRPCAVGSRVLIGSDDNWTLSPHVGFIGQDGTLTNMNVGIPLTLSKLSPPFTVQQYNFDYCEALSARCFTNCFPLHYPELTAVVLSLREG